MKTKLLIGLTIIVMTLFLVISMRQPATAANCKWLAGEWICSTWQIQPTWTPPPPEPYPYSEPLVYIYEEVYPYPAPEMDDIYIDPYPYPAPVDDDVYIVPYPLPLIYIDEPYPAPNPEQYELIMMTAEIEISEIYLSMPEPYPTPPPGLIMKSERWIEVDGLIQIFAVP